MNSASQLSPPGTKGFADVAIAKNLVEDITNLKVYLDANQLNYTTTSTSDSLLLHLTYNESMHSVMIDSGRTVAPKFTSTIIAATPLIAMAASMISLLEMNQISVYPTSIMRKYAKNRAIARTWRYETFTRKGKLQSGYRDVKTGRFVKKAF
ncbi:MAG: hypothetical protein QG670_1696 [Thermoproteota archaeon]|nr:hypothetical protein [Thermoproteota archaeon]